MDLIRKLRKKNRDSTLDVTIHLGTDNRYVPAEGVNRTVQREVQLLYLAIKNLSDTPVKIDFVEIFFNGKLVNANPHYWVHAEPILPSAIHTREYVWDELMINQQKPVHQVYVVVHTNTYLKQKSNKLSPPVQ